MFPIIPTVVVVIIATFGGALVVSCLLVICDVPTQCLMRAYVSFDMGLQCGSGQVYGLAVFIGMCHCEVW